MQNLQNPSDSYFPNATPSANVCIQCTFHVEYGDRTGELYPVQCAPLLFHLCPSICRARLISSSFVSVFG